MSADQHHETPPPSCKPTLPHMVGWSIFFLCVILMFAVLTYITLVMTRPRTLAQAEADHRAELIASSREKQKDHLTRSGWVDESKGIAHIPVTEAMKQFAAAQGDKAAMSANVLVAPATDAKADAHVEVISPAPHTNSHTEASK